MTASKEKIRILFVEDIPTDFELAQRAIRKEKIDFEYRLVETEEDFIRDLKNFKPDIVVSDYSMPVFDGMRALKINLAQNRRVPFIILTGSMNEETAVKCMKAGADDYVLKEKITRLPFAITEAIEKQTAIAEKQKVEQQLINSLHEYKDLINGMNETVWIISTDGILLDVNQRAEITLGFTREELRKNGLTNIDALHDQDWIDNMIRNLKEGRIQVFETIHITKNGKHIPVEISSSLIKYQGQTAVLSVARDITERKKAKEQIKLLSRAVEQNPIAIEITDKDGNIEYVNPVFTEITGFRADEVIGKTPRIFNSGYHSSSFYKELWDTITAGRTWHGELRNKTKSGRTYWEQATISPIFNEKEEIIHFLAIKEDITKKKKMLEDLVAAKEKAEESDHLKSAFLANMSHEIRTPMNGILGFTDLLSEPNLSREENAMYIDIIQRSGERMLETLNDIIEVSKIDSGQVQLQENKINPYSIIRELYGFFLPEANKKGLKLNFTNTKPDKPVIIFSDESKINSIATNLIKNALKFTSEGEIKMGYTIQNEILEFFVEDTGIGIPRGRQEAIFERFTKSDLQDKKAFQGSGLGLAIAKSYAEMLGGHIKLTSIPGKGAKFSVSLPVKYAGKDTSADQENSSDKHTNLPEAGSKKINILIADDDPAARKLLTLITKKYTREILYAETGTETVNICRNNPAIDVVLMDIKMPHMDGLEATRQIRKFNPDVILIAQTAFAAQSDRQEALEAGCNEYISKPIKNTELIKLINKHFDISK
ncbi:MAG: PAS domain S-box protein [Bacteroidales bacterium]